MDNTETITHLSLCSGYEGIGLGLRKVFPNLREIAYVEREGFPVANLVAKIEAGKLDSAPIFTDVKTFPYQKFRGKVDILSGGFPCQPFSQAGLRKSTEDPRHLFPYIERGIRECTPAAVFLENVEGILSSTTGDGQPVLQYVLRGLEALGYRATAGIFSASEAGAPHQRKRVFILGLGNSTSDGCYEGRFGEDTRATCQGEVKGGDGEAGQEKGRLQESEGGCSKLAHSEDIGRRGRTHRNNDDGSGLQEPTTQERPNLRSETAGCSRDLRGELAHRSSERLEGDSRDINGSTLSERNSTGHKRGTSPEGVSGRWPSRPGQPQHEWEEPRVIESKLGGATNGASSRVDRLRLLGNGCVPQTVEIAFLTLIERLK